MASTVTIEGHLQRASELGVTLEYRSQRLIRRRYLSGVACNVNPVDNFALSTPGKAGKRIVGASPARSKA